MALVQNTRSAVVTLLIFTLILGVIYPLVVTGIAQLAFPYAANGSLIRNDQGQVIGSDLLAQGFTKPEYFHPRPSAAGANGYDASASSGSNYGPTSQKLMDAVKERVDAYRKENGLADNAPIPADAVTASASGLDPEISPANAGLQVARVAKTRNLTEDQVRAVMAKYTSGRFLGLFGEPRVNVLKLNLALDHGEAA